VYDSESYPGSYSPPRPLLTVPNEQPTHQRPVYQLRIIRYSTIIMPLESKGLKTSVVTEC